MIKYVDIFLISAPAALDFPYQAQLLLKERSLKEWTLS